MERLGLCCIVLLFTVCEHALSATLDPCIHYKTINDSSMVLSYTTNAPCTNHITSSGDWYRFEASREGLLATTCPTGNQCGTANQAWMSGTIPSYTDGAKDVDICIRGSDCCERKRTTQIKNCNAYVVYRLFRLPDFDQYCFNQSSDVLIKTQSTTSSTPSTSRTVSKQPKTTTVAIIESSGKPLSIVTTGPKSTRMPSNIATIETESSSSSSTITTTVSESTSMHTSVTTTQPKSSDTASTIEIIFYKPTSMITTSSARTTREGTTLRIQTTNDNRAGLSIQTKDSTLPVGGLVGICVAAIIGTAVLVGVVVQAYRRTFYDEGRDEQRRNIILLLFTKR